MTLRVTAWPAFRARSDNPYTYLLSHALEAEGMTVTEFGLRTAVWPRSEILHVHWPEAAANRGRAVVRIAAAALMLVVIETMRRRGTKVIWTVHNAEPHERSSSPITRWYLRRLSRRTDGVISPSEAGLAAIVKRLPALAEVPSVVIPIGHFRSEYPPAVDKQVAREKLGIDPQAKLAVSIGQIRAYKGLVGCCAVMATIDDPGLRYIVAGAAKDQVEVARLEEWARKDERITVTAEHLGSAAVRDLLSAADLFVAPFRAITHSASVLLALSFDRPVLAPHLGALPELADEIGGDWIFLYEPPLTRGDLERAFESAAAATGTTDLSSLEWSDIGRRTAEFYQDIVARENPDRADESAP